MSAPIYRPDRTLAEGEHLLIEASAGTGKTYQTEGLVVRLVAERGVPIERILVITYTRAAAAELRSRVHDCLSQAHRSLRAGEKRGKHSVLDGLLALEDRAGALENLTRALRDFDRAPISTIHRFCQRTLEQQGFSAGIEPVSGVLGDPTEIRRQIVTDTLAWLYAEATEEQLTLLQAMGWTRETLADIVKDMTGAERPVVEPSAGEHDELERWVLGQTAAWETKLEEFRSWWGTPEAERCCVAYQEDAGRTEKRIDGIKSNIEFATIVENWIESGGEKASGWLKFLRLDDLENAWKDKPVTKEKFAGLELARRFTETEGVRKQLESDVLEALSAFATSARARYQAELHRRGLISYDTMLSLLAARLEEDPSFAATLRGVYEVAIVDEFQDTDGAQWAILDKVFCDAEKPGTLYVVGDPKQAIYRFRNANLAVYGQAAAKLDNYALDTNHRSDGDLVKALHTLWSGASDPFLGANIPYVEVSAWHEGRRVDAMPTVDDRERRPLELRWFDGRLLGGTATDFPSKGAVSPSVAELCALECRALLESEATIQLDEKKPARRLRASDIAVLVRYHMEGDAVRRALARHGIPAIKTNREGVLGSPVTAWVLAWLEAVAAPGVERFARVLALSPLCGWSPARLARALTEPTGEKDDPNLEHHRAWERLLGHIGTWAHNWPTQGFARVFDQALDQYDALPRLLQGDQGERLATDLRHLFELLHQEQKRSHAGPKTLAEWLRTQQVEQVDEDSDRAQRLESDAAAVKIETIHGSKGLQYPVVMVPFCWTIKDRDSRKRATRYSRPLGSDKTELVLDLHSSDSEEGKKARKKSKEEDEQEAMRLLYVAMTRAKHHLVVWAGAVKGAERSPIGRLLFSREGEQELVEIDPSMPKSRAKKAIADWEARRAAGPEMAEARIVALCEDSQDGIGWSLCLPPEHREKPWEPEEEEGLLDHLDDPVVPWNKERRLGTNWLLTSYSGLSHGKANHADEPSARRAALPEEQPEAERGDSATVVPRIPDFERGSSVDALLEAAPGYDLPGGTGTGDWLHDVFEKLVFTGGGTTAKDGRKVADLVRDLGQRHGVRDDKLHQRVLALLPGWLSTPLDSPFPSGPGIEPGLSLGALHLDQRLDELRFDLRLGVGEAWEPRMRDQKPDFTGRIHPRGVRAALDAALEDPDFGGRTWLEQLLKNAEEKKDDHGNPKRILPAIAGLLIGFIDLCFRDSRGRYFVLDYKSNALRGPEAVQAWHRSQPIPQAFKRRPSLRRAHYTGEMMAWGMSHHAYHLQALIYTVALHRLLRQRLDDYAYDTHIGGHLYLFLRGMEGKDTPRLPDPAGPRLGVWADRWPARTVWGLDAALDGADEAEVKRVMDANAGGAS